MEGLYQILEDSGVRGEEDCYHITWIYPDSHTLADCTMVSSIDNNVVGGVWRQRVQAGSIRYQCQAPGTSAKCQVPGKFKMNRNIPAKTRNQI